MTDTQKAGGGAEEHRADLDHCAQQLNAEFKRQTGGLLTHSAARACAKVTLDAAPSPAPLATGGEVETRDRAELRKLFDTLDAIVPALAVLKTMCFTAGLRAGEDQAARMQQWATAALGSASHVLATSPTRVGDGELPVDASDEMIRASLATDYPAIYREHLRHPDNGPSSRAETERRIAHERKRWTNIRAALRASGAGGGERIDGVDVREVVFRALDDATQGGPDHLPRSPIDVDEFFGTLKLYGFEVCAAPPPPAAISSVQADGRGEEGVSDV